MSDRSKKASKSPKVDQRWTLLFIGKRGRTITFKHFKGAVIATIFLVLALGALCGWLWHLNLQARQDIAAREETIQNLEKAMESLRNEKDILTARLAVIESRVEERLHPESRKKEAPAAASEAPAPGKTPLEPLPSIIADDFIVFRDGSTNQLRIEYKVRNTGSKNEPASGRTVAILKGDPDNQRKWLVLPSVPLQSGKPTGDSGRSFSIYNYRTIRFRADQALRAEQFENATIYIFSTTGTLVYEEDFPVSPG